MNTRSSNLRVLTTHLMAEVLTQGLSLSILLPSYKAKCNNANDAAFMQALIFGTLRWYSRLSFIAHRLLKKPIKAKERELHYLICIGLYQLMEMQVPAHAAIAETVEAAKILKQAWGAGVVNAILRSYQRQAQTLLDSVPHNTEALYAHPQWLIDAIKTAWPNGWAEILEANNVHPPLCIRINRQQTTRGDYLQRLNDAGVDASPIPNTQTGIRLPTSTAITKLPGFTTGCFSVQDEAAQYAATLLELIPSLRVLDACAAPGGKTTHILEIEPHLGELVALDISPLRTQRIAENLARLQLKATVITADANTPDRWWDGKLFDRILLDAPCSASGVIRRHPDIKHLRQPKDITSLAEQQLSLLQALWPLLTSGGLLLYATCSLFPEENVTVLEKFLKKHPDATPDPVSLPFGITQTIGVQLLPGQNNTDGFYYARIKKD